MNLSGLTAIVLDTTPLGLLTQRPGHIGGDTCRIWYASLISVGHRFFVPEIADYELRRKLRQTGNVSAVSRPDNFVSADAERYLPLTTPVVRLAADLWAQARRTGHITVPTEALDGDVLIAAQARLLIPADYGLADMVIATENARHFQSLAPALFWSDIEP